MQPDRILDDAIVPMSRLMSRARQAPRGPAVDGDHPRSTSSDEAAPSGLEPEALRHLARLLGRQAAREAVRVRRHGGLSLLPVGIVLALVALALAALMWVVPHLRVGAWP